MDRPPTVPPPARRFAGMTAPIIQEPTPEPAPTGGLYTVDALAKERNPPEWLVAAARARSRWVEGQEISPDDYDAAIEAVQTIEVR